MRQFYLRPTDPVVWMPDTFDIYSRPGICPPEALGIATAGTGTHTIWTELEAMDPKHAIWSGTVSSHTVRSIQAVPRVRPGCGGQVVLSGDDAEW